MARNVFKSRFFTVTHTLEEEGPHQTIPHDYYDDTFTITALLHGRGVCRVEGNCYHMGEGDIVLMGLDEIRSFQFEQTGLHERISIYFTSSVLSPLWEYELPLLQTFRAYPPGIGNKYVTKDADRQKVWDVLKEIQGMMSVLDKEPAPMQEAKMHLLILQFLFLLYDARKESEVPAGSFNNDSVIWDICRYIHENLTEKLTYQHLQERFHVSRYQLTEIFRRNTGMTLTEYILQKRLMKVTVLVRDGSSIENAAFNAGFHNYSHFYKEFVKHKHMSPQKYYLKKRQ